MANIQIPITENGTPTLATVGKYCDRNIEVVVDTPDRYEAGKKAEYDMFWDNFQNYGNRESYSYMFSTRGWTDENFKPKYDIRPIGSATSLFRYLGVTEDVPTIFERQGIVLDTSKATNLEYCCQNVKCKRLGTFDCTGLTVRLASSFSCDVIEQLKLIINDSVIFYNTFNNATKLEDLELEGTLGTNGLSLQNSKSLTHDSLMSVINALKDYSEDTSGTVWEVTIGATNLAKLTDDEQNIAYLKGWVIG